MRLFAGCVVFGVAVAQRSSCPGDWVNTAFYSVDMQVEDAEHADACRRKCFQNPLCAVWTYMWAAEKCMMMKGEAVNTAHYVENTISGAEACCACNVSIPTVMSACIEKQKVWIMTEYDISKAGSFYECHESCQNDDGLPCTGASFNVENGDCYKTFMQAGVLGAELNASFLAYYRGCCYKPSTIYHGEMRESLTTASIHDCQTECLMDADCLGFNYNTDNGACDRVYESIEMKPSSPQNIAGLKRCCDHKGLEHDSPPISSIRGVANIIDCRRRCQGRADCFFFTFHQQEGRCDLHAQDNVESLKIAENTSDVTTGRAHCYREYGIGFTADPVKTYSNNWDEAKCEAQCANNIDGYNCTTSEWTPETCKIRLKAGARVKGSLDMVQHHAGL